MSKCDPRVALQQMRDHAWEAIVLCRGKKRADLDDERLLNLGIVRLLEVVGEAAHRVPPKEQLLYSEIPWPQIISLRNRLIHGYDIIDYDIVWQIVVEDLPPLVVALDCILDRGFA